MTKAMTDMSGAELMSHLHRYHNQYLTGFRKTIPNMMPGVRETLVKFHRTRHKMRKVSEDHTHELPKGN